MSEARVSMPGSSRPAVADDELGDALDPAVIIEATLVLRRRAEPPVSAFSGPPLSRAQLGERYGADPADLEAVTSAVTAVGAEVLSADAVTRLVRVRGSVADLTRLFGTSLRHTAAGTPGSRRRSGELSLAAALVGPLTAVLGLDDRPQAAARYRVATSAAAQVGYTPLQLATAYGFPDGDGTGQTIAIIELGGGFGQDDLDAYFTGLGLTSPAVAAVSVDGADNKPGADPTGADGEVLLDIEVAGAIAPAAAQFVYFAPNTDDGFVDAITQAAHATPAPTAISISWGQSEDGWTAQGRDAMDKALADAALLGVTVTAAAGDSGSSDTPASAGAGDGAPHVDFPSSSPHILACGGTSLVLDAGGAVSSEKVWNNGAAGGATGGGVSDVFPVPDWQADAGVPVQAVAGGKAGRGVPDVAAVADPQTGYQVRIDGTDTIIGGTSAVSPLMAGLVCRLAQTTGKPLGLLGPSIYAGAAAGAAAPGFRDITDGTNGTYSAAAGWDACTGLGVPDSSITDVVTAAPAG